MISHEEPRALRKFRVQPKVPCRHLLGNIKQTLNQLLDRAFILETPEPPIALFRKFRQNSGCNLSIKDAACSFAELLRTRDGRVDRTLLRGYLTVPTQESS